MAERADPGVGRNNNKKPTERIGRGRWGVPHACVAAVVLAAALAAAVAGAEQTAAVKTEIFRGAAGVERGRAAQQAVRPPAVPQRVFALPAPTAAEIRQARPEPSPRTREAERARPATEADAPADAQRVRMPASSVFAADAADVAVPRMHQVGFGREFGARGAAVPGSEGLDWRRQPDGGLALALTVESPGAKALRAQVELRAVRAGLEVRVFDPKAPDATVVAVPAHLLAPDAAGAASAWTPTVAGDALAVELYLPPGTRPRGLRVSIPRVSHLEVEPARADEIGRARCAHQDAVCLADDISAAARSAVAKYLFTNRAGGTSMCSGTLLNDADLSSQVPYFLTAAHCIRSRELASTMEFYWFFERPECGSGEVSATRQTGGATVLARNAANREGTGLDQVLVRLDSDPPAGVALAGWLAAPAAASGDGVAVHHPRGDLKKANSGTLNGFYRWQERGLFALAAPDENGPHVRYEPTVPTEGGSSGSGLWQHIDGYDYLVGMLTGGSGWLCEGSSFYGRLDRFYPRISQWLGSTERVEDSEVSRVERVVLVDAATRAEVADLTGGGAEVDLDATATRSFDVVAEMRRPVGSVALALSGAQTAEHASDWAPHTLFGAAGGGGLGPGSYTVTVTTHPAAGLGGDALERLEVPFTVTGTGADGVAVAGLAAAVGSRPRVQTLADDAALTVYAGEAVELRARTQGAAAGSVVFAVSGPSSVAATTSDAPFGVPVTLTAGTYRIVATPYPEKDAGGTAGEALEVSGVVVATPASPVSGFTLVDAAGGLPDPDLGPLADGATVDLSATHGLASVRADLAAAATGVERVELELRGARELDRTETSAPYALFGASGGDYAEDGFPDGEYELSARAFVAGGPRGALPPAKVDFTVTGGGFATPVESLVLVNATGPAPDPDIRTIEDGATLDLSATGGWANIRVVLPAARADIRSVGLELRGASDAERVTSAAPFTLFGVAEGDYQAGLLRNGAHTLTATGYTEPGGGGFAYPPSTVAFTVTGSTSSPVTGVWLVDARGRAPDPDFRPIEDGAVVSLAETGDVSVRVSARAQAKSVRLELDGPVWWRWVHHAPFFLWGYDQNDRADARPGELPNGEYTLTAQPYTGSGGGGRALTPLTVSFTVADSPWAPTRVTGFTLLDAPGGDGADVDLARIAHGDTLILPDGSSGKFNVRADLSSAAGVVRVVTSFWPRPASRHFDEDAPFTAFSSRGTQPLAPRTYRISAKPIGSVNARMTPRSALFTVTARRAAARFAVSPEQTVLKEGESRRLTVSVDGARFARPQELTLAVTGNMSTADYALAPTLALAAGATEAHTTFTLVDDDEAEGTERATVEVRHAGSVVARARFTSVPNDQSDDARLASLSLSEIDFGTFDADTTAYATAVRHHLPGTTVAAQAAHPRARSVAIEPADADAATPGHQVAFAVGVNRIAVTVTAEIGRRRTYTVDVTRAEAPEGPVATLSATTATVAEGASVAFEAVLSEAPSAPLAVALSVSAEGVDLSGTAPASVTFPAGATTVAFRVATVDDAVASGDGAVRATLLAGDGYARGRAIAATVAVPEDDVAAFAASASPPALGEGAVSTVTLSIANGVTYAAAQEIALSVSGDVDAADYALPASIVLPAGASSVGAAFEALTDEVVEGPETATVAARLGGTEIGATTVTLVDATTAQFAVAAEPAALDEGATSSLTVSIADGVTYAAAQEIALTVSGDVEASDYALPATMTLPAGASSAGVAFEALADAVVEPSEPATVTASLGGTEIGATPVTVVDATAAQFAVAADPAAVDEGGTSTLTVSIANGVTYVAAQEIALSVSGDVDASDYAPPASVVLPAGASSVDAAFEALADAVVEGPETATVTASLGGTEIGATTVTVVDATAAQFAVAAAPAAIDEGATSTLTLSITNGVAYAAAQEIALSVSGDVEASDYALPETVELAAGASSATAAFAALADKLVEGPETATVAARLDGAEIGTATVALADGDEAAFAVAAEPARIEEGTASTVTVSITNATTYAAAQEIALTVSGDVDASDYDLPATTTLAAGASSAFAEFAALADEADEEPETATVTASLDGSEIGAASVTVADQPPLPALRVEGVPQLGATLSAVFAEPVSGPDAGTARAAGGVGGLAVATSVPARGLETVYRWLRDGVEIPGATGPAHVLTAADVGAAVSVRAARGIRSEESAATVPVWGAPGNPAVGTDEATLLSTTMTLGSRGFSTELRVDFAGYMDETWYRPVGSVDAAAFELDGTRYRLTTFAVIQDGGFAFATQPVLPSAAGLVGYWDGYRLADFVGETADANGWTTWGTWTPQPREEYERYMHRPGLVFSGPSDGVRVAVSLRREVGVPTATVSASAATVSEGGAAAFAVSLDGPREAPVAVSLETTAAGAALAAAAPSSATFAPGETEASLELATVDDAVVSGDGTVTVTLVAGDGYELGASATATMSVAEDDAAQFAVSASPAEVVEGGSSTVTVAIANGVTYATAREVSLAVTGDVSASDYALPATVALAAGASSATAEFAALEDEVAAEAREEARIAATVDGAEVGAATVAIRPLRGDATLSSLSLTDVDIGAFDAQTTEYAGTAAAAVESTTVTAEPSDAAAAVEIADAAGSTVGTQRTSALAVGSNAISATVTAEDGATTRTYAVAVARPPAWGARQPEQDIELADAAAPTGIWSDGETLWAVHDWTGTALAAYDLATAERLPGRDIAVAANKRWVDLHAHGGTLWAASLLGEVAAYRLSDGARLADRDVGADALAAAGSSEPVGLWSHGGTLWVLDHTDHVGYAFGLADGARQADRDVELGGPAGEHDVSPWGAWSDGAVLLTVDYWAAGRVRAYRLGDGARAARVPEMDVDTGTAGNADPVGLWSDGATLWVADGTDRKVYAYAVPGLRQASAGAVQSRASAVPSAAPGPPLPIPDPALRAALAAALGKPPHSPVGANELAALESLEARAAGIADLSGLQHAVRLAALDLSGNPLADLRALASLPHLADLRLDATGAQPWDVASLAGLRRLSLRGNGVDDVSGLAPLVRLEFLDVGGNRIADLWPLANLHLLAELRADGNRVADVAPLLGLSSLAALDLRGNPVDDTEALERLPRLPR